MNSKKGFTLVELLVVILIISILSLIILVKVPQFLTRAKEAKTEDSLANLRTAVGNYYSTNQGVWPVAFDDQAHLVDGNTYPPFIPHYMPKAIPRAKLRNSIPAAMDTSTVTIVTTGPTEQITTGKITDIGGWIYSSNSGDLRINSLDMDSKGERYYSNYGH